MARFDVFRLGGSGALLVVEVQATLLSDLSTRVVVPLALQTSAQIPPIARLNPVLDIAGKTYLFMPTDIAVLPSALLRAPVANIESVYRDAVTAALDFLFQGF
jgi:toxin CcdB